MAILYKRLVLAIALAGCSNAALAKSITLVGSIEAHMPEPNASQPSGDVVANVKSYTLDVDASADGCTLTYDESLAQNGSSESRLYCLLEWSTSDAGLNQSALNVTGIPTVAGNLSATYSVSYFSGSSHEKITIAEGSIAETVLEPVPPVMTSVETRWGSGTWRTGYQPVNHDPSDPLRIVRVDLEPRNYDQRIDIDIEGGAHTCSVPEGDTQCSMTVNVSLGAEEGDALQGVLTQQLAANSANQFYDDGVYSSLLDLAWDYRPPVVEYAVFNADFNAETITHDVDGTPIEIGPDEGLVVVSSPHAADEGDWWQPRRVTLDFTPDENGYPVEPYKVVDGYKLFTGRTLTYDDNYTLDSYGSQIKVGDKLAYKVRVSSVPDGGYAIDVNAQDSYANAKAKSVGDHWFSRDEPQLAVFNNYQKLSEGGSFYFVDHLVVAGFNNFKDALTINQVTIDGQVAVMEQGEDASVQYLSSEGLSFSPNTLYDVEIQATGINDQPVVSNQQVTFAPVTYELSGAASPIYQKLTENRFYLNQAKGQSCRMVATNELANQFGMRSRPACVVEWPLIPEGMYVDEGTQGAELHGVMEEEGAHLVNYRMVFFDGEGNSVVVADNTSEFEVVAADVPEVAVYGREEITSTLFAAELKGGRFADAKVLSVPAKVEMVSAASDGEEDYYFWKERRNKRDPSAQQKGSARLYVEPGDLWETRNVEVGVNYQLQPEVAVSETVDVAFVPSKSIRTYVSLRDDLMLSSEELKIGAKVATYSRASAQYNYDLETYGQWMLTLERRLGRNEYEDIAGPILYDGTEDEAVFTIPGDEWLGKNKMCVRAEVVSPIEGYERVKRSRCINVAVFKGEAIEGALSGKYLTDRIPFDAVIRYKPATDADEDSMGEIIWQVSDDGGDTWSTYPASSRRPDEMYLSLDEAGEWDVRAIVHNQFTTAVTTTESLHVIAYDTPNLEIIGQKDAYIGEPDIKLSLWDSITDQLADGDIEWSMDDGRNWESGDAEVAMDTSVARTVKVKARMRYAETDPSIGDGWDETTFYFRVTPPQSPSIKADIPSSIEVGEQLYVAATISENRLGTSAEWVHPDGSITSGAVLDVIVPEAGLADNYENRNYTLRAWVDGYKEQTLKTKVGRIKVWKYEIPTPTVKVRTKVKYVPAYVDIEIRDPKIFAPDVEFTKDIDFDAGQIELIERVKDKFKLKINTIGSHDITAILSDNRGGQATAIEFFDALESIPMTVSMRTRSYSNKTMKEPLSTYLYADRKLSHSMDSVTSIRWYLNGELQNTESATPIYWNMEDLAAGTHTLRVETDSDFGQSASDEMVIEVVDNVLPECEVEFSQDTSALNFQAQCRDPDGSMKTYSWYMNGDYVGGSDRMKYYKNPHLSDVSAVDVKLVGCDDSFECIESTKTYTVTH
ncbi:hypothetical protein K0504_09610 [Neiella marina]|uniref:Ig-like domain-containing protein n=1 Tax=Neiella holothuriorum TaxID=2870530 RepID=A0ABS7EG30_9GAMM|nr:hypothetical protein [Neiella holothuriorum]MBW8191292.1 hypothetical protein [Neiella holothuriorum]